MKQVKQTYYEMIVAIVVQTILICIIGTVITKQYIIFPVSVVLGCVIAIIVLTHMMRNLTVIVELDPQTAKRYGTKQALVRMIIMTVAVCLSVYYSEYINPWGVLCGMATLKFAAYLQMPIHKICEKIDGMKGRK